MKILFIGTVEFSFNALEKIITLGGEVVGVVTKKKSNFNSDFIDLTPLCIKNNIDYNYVEDINLSDSVNWIKNKNPDIIFCFGWSSLIQNELLDLPPKGIIGYHPALLPCNRGRHPIIWALFLGLSKTGSTFFFMDKGADSGDILSQKEIVITKNDDAGTLYNKISNIAIKQIEEFLPQLQLNSYPKIKQNDKEANYWRKRTQKDGIVDFRMSSFSIYNLVRALTKPYIGASIFYDNHEIKIWKVQEESINLDNIECGKILEVDNNTILVKCYRGAIRIVEHSFEKLPQKGEYL